MENGKSEQVAIHEVIIEGIMYALNYEKNRFDPMSDGASAIPFNKLRPIGDNNYLLHYDLLNKEPLGHDAPVSKESGLITIPGDLLDGKKGMTWDEVSKFNAESFEAQRRIVILDRDMRLRLSGKLPRIYVDGSPYTVDMKQLRLVYLLNPSQCLPLNYMQHSRDMKTLSFIFDRATRQMVGNVSDLLDNPKDKILVKIPSERYLDPVGMAARMSVPYTQYLSTFPFKMDSEAEMYRIDIEQLRKDLEKKMGETNTPKRKRGYGLG